ncbi:hypothetical protein [Methanosarcina sp.]|uniref:hypothetical protein n=1 Tax=Methanosarcina sp. TaxID=2213 RepID=UPI003C795DEE
MNINLKEERLILALMTLVIIYLLFFSSVAFGQVKLSRQKHNVSGTVFYSDGKTPLIDNSSTHIDLFNADVGDYFDWDGTDTDSNGYYSFTNVPPGTFAFIHTRYPNFCGKNQ